MEAIKWVASLVIGLCLGALAIGAAICTFFIGIALQIGGLILLVGGGFAVAIKEYIDHRSDKKD